ncbi:hypothetical protein K449DRAFT_176771 [Hypoxylon sp. EC38]|nr:hypothetical protein K449DRAFT_176771 [Hypoxylon sp. EC38]
MENALGSSSTGSTSDKQSTAYKKSEVAAKASQNGGLRHRARDLEGDMEHHAQATNLKLKRRCVYFRYSARPNQPVLRGLDL